MVFKTLQHYSDGEVVRWIQEPQPNAAEPERPAPVLKLLPRSENGAYNPTVSRLGTPAASQTQKRALGPLTGPWGCPRPHWSLRLGAPRW
jgi:hypothetical protein